MLESVFKKVYRLNIAELFLFYFTFKSLLPKLFVNWWYLLKCASPSFLKIPGSIQRLSRCCTIHVPYWSIWQPQDSPLLLNQWSFCWPPCLKVRFFTFASALPMPLSLPYIFHSTYHHLSYYIVYVFTFLFLAFSHYKLGRDFFSALFTLASLILITLPNITQAVNKYLLNE